MDNKILSTKKERHIFNMPATEQEKFSNSEGNI
jgi:hypothetical protein